MAASTNDCMSIWELTNQWPGGVNGLRELQYTKMISAHAHTLNSRNGDSLPSMYSLQTLRHLFPHTLPLQIKAWHPALLYVRLVLPPVQRECDSEQLARKRREFVEGERVARGHGRGGSGEELVVAHREEGLGV